MEETLKSLRGQRKERNGVVVSDKMEKSVVVKVATTFRHPVYSKVITREKKYYAHNELGPLKVGDKVLIKECRPYSKMKRWLVIKKMEG